jgi:hypothetical protein
VPDPPPVLPDPPKPPESDIGEAPFAGVSLEHPIPARRRVAIEMIMYKLFIIIWIVT